MYHLKSMINKRLEEKHDLDRQSLLQRKGLNRPHKKCVFPILFQGNGTNLCNAFGLPVLPPGSQNLTKFSILKIHEIEALG